MAAAMRGKIVPSGRRGVKVLCRRRRVDALPERALQSAAKATARGRRRPRLRQEALGLPVSHDVLAFGEALLRLQPEGDGRIEDAVRFLAHPGGAELNTCF